MTSKIVMGSAFQPPREAGSDSRNKPAFFTWALGLRALFGLSPPPHAPGTRAQERRLDPTPPAYRTGLWHSQNHPVPAAAAVRYNLPRQILPSVAKSERVK